MKQHVSQLAIFGGSPLFETPLHVGQPNVTDPSRLIDRISDVLNSGYLTNHGPQVAAFEGSVASLCGVKHCIAVCNGTMALQIMTRSCNLTGEVIVPSMTFVATPHSLEWMGLTPVFADVDPVTQTLDPESVAACITPRTTAILGVHLWGNPCQVDQLTALAEQHNLKLLFDASHAFGCQHNGTPIGGFGEAEVFSFHATKFVHAVEGGAIVTNNDALAERCRLLRNFGITGLTSIESAGTNGKMNELVAAVGLCSLQDMDTLLSRNRENHRSYQQNSQDCPGLEILPCTADDGGNSQYVVALINEDEFGLTRDQVLQVLRAEGIFVRSYFVPGCHNAHPYRGVAVHHPVELPTTERLLDQVIQFPTGVSVTELQIRNTSELIRFVHSHADEIRAQLTRMRGEGHFHQSDPAAVTSAVPDAA